MWTDQRRALSVYPVHDGCGYCGRPTRRAGLHDAGAGALARRAGWAMILKSRSEALGSGPTGPSRPASEWRASEVCGRFPDRLERRTGLELYRPHLRRKRRDRRRARPHAGRPPEGRWPKWLGEEPATEDELVAMLEPCDDEALEARPVNKMVGNVKNNGAQLLTSV